MEVVSEQVTVRTGRESMPCHLARPATGGAYPALIVVMEAFGLNRHIQGITDRFAAEGFVALSPNLYFRQPDNVVGYGDLPRAMSLGSTLTDDQVIADMGAAIDYLKTRNDVRPNVGVVGFCLGGRVSFLTACRIPAVNAAASFYGGLISPRPGRDAAIDYAEGLKAPVLAFFGGKDQHIPVTDADQLRDRLKAAGKQAEVVVYSDADHGFMCDERPESFHSTHSQDAWTKVIGFFKKHLG